MAYPSDYTRQYDYQSYQNANPTRPLPADKINAEFNEIATRINAIIDFLQTLVAADGTLNNGVVTYDDLAAEVQALIPEE